MITKRDARIFIPSFLALVRRSTSGLFYNSTNLPLQFASAYSITMLFPFLPFMIEFLLPRVKEEDIGQSHTHTHHTVKQYILYIPVREVRWHYCLLIVSWKGLWKVHVVLLSSIQKQYEVYTLPMCSYVWGAVSDKKGRKPVVVVSCLLIGIFSAAFGFSVKIYTAIIFRFLVGLFNGKPFSPRFT